MTFYPADAPIPDGTRTADLSLVMLGPEVVELDYDAIMESRERLRLWSSSTWPEDHFTLDDNLADMHMHAREFHEREAFAYSVLNSDHTRVEGCIYINPLGRFLRTRDLIPEHGADPITDVARTASVSFWVRDSALPRDLDRQLVTGLLRWFNEAWAFPCVTFLTRDTDTRDHALLRDLGLPLIARLRPHEPGAERQLWLVPLDGATTR